MCIQSNYILSFDKLKKLKSYWFISGELKYHHPVYNSVMKIDQKQDIEMVAL